MKKLIVTGFFALLAVFTVQAQNQKTVVKANKPSIKRMNHEERANKHSARMINSLDLTEAQGTKIKAINLEYAEKVKELQAISKTTGDKTGLKEGITVARQEQKAALNKELTPEQAKKWADIQKNNSTPNAKKRVSRRYTTEKS